MTFSRCLVFTRLEFKKSRRSADVLSSFCDSVGLPGVLVCSNRLRRSGGLRAVEENAKIAHASVEFVSKITAGTFRMLFEDMTIGRVTLELPCVQR